MWFKTFIGRGDFGMEGTPGLRGQIGEKVFKINCLNYNTKLVILYF